MASHLVITNVVRRAERILRDIEDFRHDLEKRGPLSLYPELYSLTDAELEGVETNLRKQIRDLRKHLDLVRKQYAEGTHPHR